MGTDKRGKILCVEDDSDSCELVTIILPEFEIVTARSKAEAIQRIKENEFAMVLLDYHLPDGTGEEACYAIRHVDQRVPILFVTGSSSITSTKALAIGAQGVIWKVRPDFVDELRLRVGDLVFEARLNAALSHQRVQDSTDGDSEKQDSPRNLHAIKGRVEYVREYILVQLRTARQLYREGYLTGEFYRKKLIELNSKYLDELNAVILLSETDELKDAERNVFDDLETMNAMFRSLQELGPHEDDTFLLPNEH